MTKRHKRFTLPATLLSALALTSGGVFADVEKFSLQGNALHIDTNTNDFTVTVIGNNSFQVTFLNPLSLNFCDTLTIGSSTPFSGVNVV